MKHTTVVELFYDGTWNDAPVYTRDPIQLGQGRADEQATTPPASCELTLDNRSGNYNPRNPASPLYGKLGRNTPLRVTVDGSVRFAGEVAGWQPHRSIDAGDAWVKLTANGISRRLGQGASPALSAPRAYIRATAPAAYWPLEDGPAATVGKPDAGPHPVTLTTGVPSPQSWGRGELGVHLPPVLFLDTELISSSIGANVVMTGFVGEWAVHFMRSGGNSTESSASIACEFYYERDGQLVRAFIQADTPSQTLHLRTPDLATLDTAVVPEWFDDNPHHVRVQARQVGADINWQVHLDGDLLLIGDDTNETLTPLRRITQLTPAGQGAFKVSIGHLAAWADNHPPVFDAVPAALGHPAEAAGRRIERLCGEYDVPFTSTGDLDDTTLLGPQYADPLLGIVTEAAETDAGILHDNVTALGLHYRTRTSLYDQAPVLALDFDAGHLAPTLEPTLDDQLVRNDVTAKRRDGSDHRLVDQDGPLGVDTIGRYDTSVTVNVANDAMLPAVAGWRLGLGTHDADRWPRIPVDLDAAPELAGDVDAIRPGDLLTLDNLPEHLAAEQAATLMVQGWSETIGSHRRIVTFLCTPAGPYDVAKFGTDRFDTAGSELATGVDADDATLSVAVTGPLWTTDDAETPFDVLLDGELLTVLDIAGAASPQTFTVTRSANGVAKPHAAGARLRLAHTPRFAL